MTTTVTNDNRYIVLPYDLTERQLLIYFTLYKKCDFKTMKVSITVDNIITSISIVNLTYKTVYSDLKKMCEKGYIEVITKSAKGKAPTYRITKVKKKGNQRETKGKPRGNQNIVIPTVTTMQRETKGKPKGNQRDTISKDKDIDNNIYSRVITRLNEKASKNYRSTTRKTITLIDARLKEGFIEEDFYKVIDNKVDKWLHETNMNIYLRPETLFGNKFESYLNEEVKENKTNATKGKILEMKIGD